MDYYSARRGEVLTQATAYVNLEDTVLSEISQPQKDKRMEAKQYTTK